MNNKLLLGIFVVLLALYLGSKLFKGNKQSSFDPQVVQVDTAMVEMIRIHPKGAPGETFTLEKAGGQWKVKNDALEVDAVTSSVKSLLNQLVTIRAKRVVSKSPEKWPDYEVEASSGTRVEVSGNGKSLADFIVGAFKYDQTNQSASSYIRKTAEHAVYVVDGFLAMTFNQQFNNFRNKEILKLNASDLTTIRLLDGVQAEAYQKVDGQWLYAGMEPLDSTQMAGYINGITTVNGLDFADDFEPGSAAPIKTLEIEANNQMSEIRITAYTAPEKEEQPFVIHSNQNPEAYFLSDSTGIYDRLFGKLQTVQPAIQ